MSTLALLAKEDLRFSFDTAGRHTRVSRLLAVERILQDPRFGLVGPGDTFMSKAHELLHQDLLHQMQREAHLSLRIVRAHYDSLRKRFETVDIGTNHQWETERLRSHPLKTRWPETLDNEGILG